MKTLNFARSKAVKVKGLLIISYLCALIWLIPGRIFFLLQSPYITISTSAGAVVRCQDCCTVIHYNIYTYKTADIYIIIMYTFMSSVMEWRRMKRNDELTTLKVMVGMMA